MKLNKLALLTAISSVLALPLVANAGHLYISNATTYTLSFSINGVCSSDFGALPSHEVKLISKEIYNKACNSDICQITAYNKKHCEGSEIGGVEYRDGQNNATVFGKIGNHISITANKHALFYSEAISHDVTK